MYKMLLLITVVLLSMTGSVFAIDHWWHGGVSDDLNDPANWTDRDASTDPTTPTGPSRTDIVRIGGSWDSEDLNGNGILDPGEDLNGNGLIDDPNPDPNEGIGWGGYYGTGGGIDLDVDPVLRNTYVSRDGLNSIGWLFVLNAPNILTLEDGAFLIISRQDSNLRNGGRIEVQGRSDTDGPSLVVPHSFRIAENGSVTEAAHETSQLRIKGTGWVQMDPAIRGSGKAFLIGTSDEPGTMPRGEIIIENDGRLEILPGDDPNNVPYLDFGNADPSVNQIIIRGNGELLMPGDPATMGVVGPNDVVTSLQEMIDTGLITSETGITVSGSNPTIIKANPSPFTVVDLPAIGTDAAIGIDPSKTYTHAFDFGSNVPVVINGLVFDQALTETMSVPFVGVSSQGYRYIIDDTRAEGKKFRPHGGNDPSALADGDSAEMLRDMIYFSNNAPAGEGISVTLQDLVPGTKYSARYYYRKWDDNGVARPVTVTAAGAEPITIDIDGPGAHYLDYTFVADSNEVTVNFITGITGEGPHIYGLTCEEIPVIVPTAAIIVNPAELTSGFDQAQYDRLVAMGYEVTVVPQGDVGSTFTIDNANTVDLLIISESISSSRADPLRGTTTPAMHNEGYGWDNWYMTTGAGAGWQTGDG
ncbi:MAG: hypothetical protein JW715_05290, partial [Sedimentisphaerales bacterium]|nr:hypothetical protein [Sedimentisphaerales bacterium]